MIERRDMSRWKLIAFWIAFVVDDVTAYAVASWLFN